MCSCRALLIILLLALAGIGWQSYEVSIAQDALDQARITVSDKDVQIAVQSIQINAWKQAAEGKSP